VNYVIAGYSIVLGILFLYTVNLIWRRRRLNRLAAVMAGGAAVGDTAVGTAAVGTAAESDGGADQRAQAPQRPLDGP
jgi:hypothetical protein